MRNKRRKWKFILDWKVLVRVRYKILQWPWGSSLFCAKKYSLEYQLVCNGFFAYNSFLFEAGWWNDWIERFENTLLAGFEGIIIFVFFFARELFNWSDNTIKIKTKLTEKSKVIVDNNLMKYIHRGLWCSRLFSKKFYVKIFWPVVLYGFVT